MSQEPTERLDQQNHAVHPASSQKRQSSFSNDATQQNLAHTSRKILGFQLPSIFPEQHSHFAPQPMNTYSMAHVDLPWSDRSPLQGMLQFGPDIDGFVVIVTPEAVRDLQEGTRNYTPNEAFGNLMGKTFVDDKGVFTVVTGAVYARKLNTGPAHVKLTHEEMYQLRLEAMRRHFDSNFIGWTHSHSYVSDYSQIDLIEQTSWSDNYSVGILTFMEYKQGEPWSIAYRGPRSIPLQRQEETSLFNAIGQQSTFPVQQFEGRAVVETSNQSTIDTAPNAQSSKRPSNVAHVFRTTLAVLAVLWLLTFTLSTGFLLYRIDGNTTTLRSQIRKVSVGTIVSPTADVGLLWNCDTYNGVAPLKVQCNGPINSDIKEWMWDFGDGTTQQSSTISHTYRNPGTYMITLTITFSSGKQSMSTLRITVTPPIVIQPTSTAKS